MRPFQTLIPVRIYLGTQMGQVKVSDFEKEQLHQIFAANGLKTYAWIEAPSFFEGGFEASLQIGFSVDTSFGFSAKEVSGSAEKLVQELLQTFNQYAVGVEVAGVYARYSLNPNS